MVPAERRLWKAALGVVAGSKEHRFARLFGNWRDLEIGIEHAESSLVEDPKQREDIYQLKASRGATDPVREYRTDHPEVSEEEALTRIRASVGIQNEIAEARAKRMAADPAGNAPSAVERGFQTEAQKTGRTGGEHSVRPE